MADLDRNSLYVMQIIKPKLTGEALRARRDSKTGIYSLTPPADYDSVAAEGSVYPYTFPMPYIDGFAGSYVTNIDGGDNANGDYEGIVISSKVNISAFSWYGLDAETGRTLLRLFVGGDNLTFFARYYDVILDSFIIRQFRRGDIEYEINNIRETVVDGQKKIDIDYWKTVKIPVSEV